MERKGMPQKFYHGCWTKVVYVMHEPDGSVSGKRLG
jgi:hypothetical protein